MWLHIQKINPALWSISDPSFITRAFIVNLMEMFVKFANKNIFTTMDDTLMKLPIFIRKHDWKNIAVCFV